VKKLDVNIYLSKKFNQSLRYKKFNVFASGVLTKVKIGEK